MTAPVRSGAAGEPRRAALVTGAAGFIGANLVSHLLEGGWQVRGVDAFTDYYEPALKRANVAALPDKEAFELVPGDLSEMDVDRLLDGVTHVFHLAGQPGVRESWSRMASYVHHNVVATHRLVEAVVKHPGLERLVYASSSSVYGEPQGELSRETDRCSPFSPYGVTKLAAEHLVGAAAANFGIPAVSLRYFSVYGPGQRPDMAFARLIQAAHSGREFSLLGDGHQEREFTYVGDVVRANVLAATTPGLPLGSVYNVCGGSRVSMREVLELFAEIVGPVRVRRLPAAAGDVRRTAGDCEKFVAATGWMPQVELQEGLRRQVTADPSVP